MINSGPIFIMSSERSGSNLLRALLSNHSRLHGPTAPHLLGTFWGLSPHYGPLSREFNLRRLFDDMLAIVNHPYHAWDQNLNFESMVSKYQPTGFLGVFDALYRSQASENGKARFVCKENSIFTYAFQLRAHYPEARFLYLCRDPRDYVASWMKNPVHLRTPYDAAVNWAKEQATCLALIDTYGFSALEVRYESLVKHTVEALTEILKFVGEEPEASCFQNLPARHPEAARNPLWENLAQPVLSDNFRKYGSFPDTTVEMIETLTGPMMDRLGYAGDTKRAWRPGLGFRLSRRLSPGGSRGTPIPLLAERMALQEQIRRRVLSRKEAGSDG